MILPRSDLGVLAAIHDYPEASVAELAAHAGLSETTLTKARARLAAQGLWGPWYDLDLAAVQVWPLTLHIGRMRPGARDVFSEERVPDILASLAIPGVFFQEDGQLLGITLPGSLEKAVAVEAALLGERVGSGADPAVATMESFAIPHRGTLDESIVDYAHVFDLLLTRRPPQVRRHFATHRLQTEGKVDRPLTPAERATLVELLQRPGESLAEAAAAAGVARRTFARAKASLRERGVIRPGARANLFGLGFRYFLLVAQRHRPIAQPERRTRLVHDLVKGSVPVAGWSSPTHTVAVAPFYTLEAARAARRRADHGLPGVENLAPPSSVLFSYIGMRRSGFAVAGDVGSAWLHALWESPSFNSATKETQAARDRRAAEV